ncbi:MAG TPA: hypothetical protein PKA59_00900 [Chakrabartia sp.]|nr:hypothetical protein [Chakrabartia sp.]
MPLTVSEPAKVFVPTVLVTAVVVGAVVLLTVWFWVVVVVFWNGAVVESPVVAVEVEFVVVVDTGAAPVLPLYSWAWTALADAIRTTSAAVIPALVVLTIIIAFRFILRVAKKPLGSATWLRGNGIGPAGMRVNQRPWHRAEKMIPVQNLMGSRSKNHRFQAIFEPDLGRIPVYFGDIIKMSKC